MQNRGGQSEGAFVAQKSQMIDVIDLQRKVPVELAAVREFCDRARAAVTETASHRFSVAFISDRRMKQLNQLFRGKDSTTDVLSFPHEPDDFDPDKNNLGDIVISAEQAKRQAAENGLDLADEIKQLILHGLLHLCGYEHETDNGEMDQRELELREKLGL
jgi:probable rRNA maturation factor